MTEDEKKFLALKPERIAFFAAQRLSGQDEVFSFYNTIAEEFKARHPNTKFGYREVTMELVVYPGLPDNDSSMWVYAESHDYKIFSLQKNGDFRWKEIDAYIIQHTSVSTPPQRQHHIVQGMVPRKK